MRELPPEPLDHRADAPVPGRRRLLRGALALGAGLAGGSSARIAAAALAPTPPQSTGPFYPSNLPLDSDNDLVQVAGRAARARGEITNVVGRVTDERGRAVRAALVEIWQCDAYGRYHHPQDRRDVPLDENFQGYGRFATGGDGAYRFRTIKPVPYPGRAPHIHFRVRGPGIGPLTTQMYIAGAPENERDWLLNNVRDRRARQSLIVAIEPDPANPGEFTGRFDLVLSGDGRYG